MGIITAVCPKPSDRWLYLISNLQQIQHTGAFFTSDAPQIASFVFRLACPRGNLYPPLTTGQIDKPLSLSLILQPPLQA